MNRRSLLGILGTMGLAPAVLRSAAAADKAVKVAPHSVGKVEHTDEEWRKLLPAASYAVLRHEGTEHPFTSPLNQEKRKGVFQCAGCDLPLFSSSTKFESGTGWPSFYDVLPGSVSSKSDYQMALPRTEYHCVRCGGHQGHVFDDGPRPTGLRYCNNGVALKFVAA